MELALRCELLRLYKTSVTRRMYARGPTPGATLDTNERVAANAGRF